MGMKKTLAALVLSAFAALSAPDSRADALLGLTLDDARVVSRQHGLAVDGDFSLQHVFRDVGYINGGREREDVPPEYLAVDQQMRAVLNGSDLFLLAGSIYYVDKNTGKYEPGHGAYDLYFFVGSKHGDPKTRDDRSIVVEHEGRSYVGNRDRNDATHYYSAELANAVNMIEDGTGQRVTNAMMRGFVRLNASVGGVDVPLDAIVIGRRTGYDATGYFISTEEDAEGRFHDVWLICPAGNVPCPDAEGRPIPYLGSRSQSVPLEHGYVLRHIIIAGHAAGEGYAHVKNPEVAGHPAVLIVPRAGMPGWLKPSF